MYSQLFMTRGTGTVAAGTTRYGVIASGFHAGGGAPATESNSQTYFDYAGKLSKFTVKLQTNAASGGATVFTLRKNSADGNQTVSFPASTTGTLTDSTNTDTVAAGDLIGTKVVVASGGVILDRIQTIVFECNNHYMWYIPLAGASASTTGTAISGTQYIPPISSLNSTPASTESNVQKATVVGCTIVGLRGTFPSNTRNGSTTFTLRVNGSSVSNTFTVPSSTTGSFRDSSNEDTIVTDDLVTVQSVVGGSSGAINISFLQFGLYSKTSNFPLISEYPGTHASGSTQYLGLGYQEFSTTESQMQVPLFLDYLISRQCINVVINTAPGSITNGVRINGSTVLSVTIPSSTTGVISNTGEAYGKISDLICIIYNPPASGTVDIGSANILGDPILPQRMLGRMGL